MIVRFLRRAWMDSRDCIVVSGTLFLVMLLVLGSWKHPLREENLIVKKEAERHVVKADLLTPVWLRKGWGLGTALAGAACLGSPWLGRRRREGMRFREAPGVKPLRRTGLLGAAALMLFAAWQNYPRLFHSLWGDEEYNASVFILDELLPRPDGTVEASGNPWGRTLWDMRKPTNHIGYSVLARLAHDTFFHRKDGPTDAWFSEALLRAPVFIAGLLLIPATLWALRVWGLLPWWALALLVLHPWFERFGSEARGYAFVMLGATLLLGTLGRALQTARWAWWLAFGLGEFLTIWCCLQSLYPLVGLNLLALGCMMERGLEREERWVLAGRWVCSSLLGAALVLVLMAPCWPQLQKFMKTGEMTGPLDLVWWQNSFSALLFGQLWFAWGDGTHPFQYAMKLLLDSHPVLSAAAIAAIVGLVLAGLVAMARRREWRPLLLFSMGSLVVMLVHMAASQHQPYDWYLCAFLPGWVVVMAAGSSLPGKLPRTAGALIMGLVVLAFAWVTQRPRELLRAHPSEAGRESVALVRKVTNPFHPDYGKGVISAGFPISMGCYDPFLLRVDDADGLRALMVEAGRTGKILFFNANRMSNWRADNPGLRDLLEDRAVFEHIASLPGLMSYASRDVFHYCGPAP